MTTADAFAAVHRQLDELADYVRQPVYHDDGLQRAIASIRDAVTILERQTV